MAYIFLLDDDAEGRRAIAIHLRLSDHEVEEFDSASAVRVGMANRKPDLLLLEASLPEEDGFSFAKKISEGGWYPFLFLTHRGQESDRITGLELGAEDYIVKPFSLKELVLRIDRILGRIKPVTTAMRAMELLCSGSSLQIDDAKHLAILDGTPLRFTATEWRILTYLLSNLGAVVSRDKILDHCFQYTFSGYDRVVDTHIKNIRAKLLHPAWIETVRGYGYRFAGTRKTSGGGAN